MRRLVSALEGEDRECRAEIVCGAHLLLPHIPEDGENGSGLLPAEGLDDGEDGAFGAGGVVATVDDEAEGNSLALAGLRGSAVLVECAADLEEDRVEVVLERPTHVAEVGRGDEDDGVGLLEFFCVRLKGMPGKHLDALDLLVTRAGDHSLGEPAEGVGRAVVDDEKGLHPFDASRRRAAYRGAVLILLPPSESKSGRRRGSPPDPSSWSFPELAEQRQRVAGALAEVSASPDAPRMLGVSPNLLNEIARNLDLEKAPATPAREVYTGVLYDALDLRSLSPAAKRRATRWIVVVSALYGAVHLADAIAPYRLAMGVDLPGIGPLAKAWRPHLDQVLHGSVGKGCIVDCRSAAYVSAWVPGPELSDRWAAITVPGASHMAKHTRGLVARHLVEVGADPRSVPGLAAVLEEGFEVQLTPPPRSGKPWNLAVTPR